MFQNKVKQASIDNLPDIISSAQKSEIRASIAMQGECFDFILNLKELSQEQKNFILKRTKIFGRANPDQKKNIILALKERKNKSNKCVGFVGDGANDFKALNIADFGLSIDNPDATIASPFVSSENELYILEKILIEGKFSIENFNEIFIYSLFYSITDTICLIIILKFGYYYSNWKYILDFFSRLPLLLIVCSILHKKQLNRVLPNKTLINSRFYAILIFICSQCLVTFCFAIAILHRFFFFKKNSETFNSINLNVENHFNPQSALLIMLNFSISFAGFLLVVQGRVIKKAWYSNVFLVLYLLILFIFVAFSTNPEPILGLNDVTAFFVKYARANEFQDKIFLKWSLFCLLNFFITYFGGSYIMNYYHYKKMKKGKMKFLNRFTEKDPNKNNKIDDGNKKAIAFQEQNTFSTISVSHSIIYDY